MPVRRTCAFCGKDMEPGRGKMFIRRDGTALFFCSSKCQKNQLKLGRIGRTVRWTKRYGAKARAAGSLAAEGVAAASQEGPQGRSEGASAEEE